MKITIKQARETLPSEVANKAIEIAKAGHTNKLGFDHRDQLYFDEDSKYFAFFNGEWRQISTGGEWGGYKANDPIGKNVNIPVGAYIIERQYFLGKLMVRIIHNNGQLQITK